MDQFNEEKPNDKGKTKGVSSFNLQFQRETSEGKKLMDFYDGNPLWRRDHNGMHLP